MHLRAHLRVLSLLQYRVQLTEGCGNARCTNAFCATARGSTLAPSVASVLALQLVRQGMPTLCVPDPSSSAHHRPGPALLCKDVKSGGTILHRVLQTSAYASLLLDDVNGTTSASHAATSTARADTRRDPAVPVPTEPPSVGLFDELADMAKRRSTTTAELARVVRTALSDPCRLSDAFPLAVFEQEVDWCGMRRALALLVASSLKEHELWVIVGESVASALRRAHGMDELVLPPLKRARLFAVALEICLLLRKCEATASSGRFLSLIGRSASALAPQASEVCLTLRCTHVAGACLCCSPCTATWCVVFLFYRSSRHALQLRCPCSLAAGGGG
jgi:hypothetical protein